MENEYSDAYLAGRLIHWALQPKKRPAMHEEYSELIGRFHESREFQELVKDVANGMGLEVLDVSDHGIVLGPNTESVFALSGASFQNRAYGEERLLDGLVQVAIAATVFPTAQELEQEATFARPELSVIEVAETLDRICEQLKDAAKNQPDPIVDEENAGLEEAWRLYLSRRSAHKNKDNQFGPKSCHRVIQRNLDKLVDYGCFTKSSNDDSYQSTWHYHVLVGELAATSLYQKIMEVQNEDTEPTFEFLKGID